MIEIQLTVSGPWIPLIRARATMDLGIGEAARILNAGLTGVRVMTDDRGHILWEAYRYMKPGTPGERFAWRSGTMAAPAFADL